MRSNDSATVTIYSSNWCGYCLMAKRLLESKGVDFEERVVDGEPNVRAEMVERAGRTSVPQIFVGGQHVGGCDDLYALDRSGELDRLLSREAEAAR